MGRLIQNDLTVFFTYHNLRRRDNVDSGSGVGARDVVRRLTGSFRCDLPTGINQKRGGFGFGNEALITPAGFLVKAGGHARRGVVVDQPRGRVDSHTHGLRKPSVGGLDRLLLAALARSQHLLVGRGYDAADDVLGADVANGASDFAGTFELLQVGQQERLTSGLSYLGVRRQLRDLRPGFTGLEKILDVAGLDETRQQCI